MYFTKHQTLKLSHLSFSRAHVKSFPDLRFPLKTKTALG